MSRKFNVGRQNDLLLNDKLHNLYTHLEFISYKDGNGEIVTMPRQTKQTAIPKGALWLQHPQGSNTHKLRVHTDPEASNIDDRWPCLFEGYYHPITLRDLPENPVHGQLWIDDQNILRVYNANTTEGKWDEVCTKLVADMKYDVFNGLDFQLIDPLLPIELDSGEELSIYTVPYESFGKYYTAKEHGDEYIYCHPNANPEKIKVPNYNLHQTENTITIDGESDNYAAKAWVHVNPYNLDKITKRLIKINKPRTYYKLLDQSLVGSIIEKLDADGNKIKVVPITNEDGELIEAPVFEVVDNNTKLVDFEPGYMIKVGIANRNKYIQTADFKINDYITTITVTDQNTGFVPVPAGKTEYFALKSGARGSDEYDNKIGRLLKRYSLKEGLEDEIVNNDPTILDHRNDYEIKNGGIVLDPEIYENYDYIYAISYAFRSNHSIDGDLIRIHKESLDGPDQMYVGSVAGIPVVFMDGLYLEHYDERGKEIYTYQNENIIFAGNDVLDNMQILVISFPKVNTYKDGNGLEYPKEYTMQEASIRNRYDICNAEDLGALQVVDIAINDSAISYSDVILHTPDLRGKIDTSGSCYVRMSNTKDVIIKGDPGDSLFDEENFPNPLIFYSGLAGYTFVDNEAYIDYNSRTVTIHNYGSYVDDDNDYRDLSTIFAVSLGKNNYKGYGILEDGVLYDETISADNEYLVIVDGIVMSPYNEDITIEDGKITITDATVALDSECTFIQLTGENDNLIDDTDAVICIYDDMFTPYSIPIKRRNAMNTSNAFDDCDSAVVMCGPGALVDREAIQREFDASDTFVGGQIVRERKKSVTDNEIYEWRMYTYSNEYVILDPVLDAQIIQDCENMITYYTNDGTVLLNPVNIDDQPVTVYAYIYVDSVDEKLLRGQRLIPIEVPGHSNNTLGFHTYSTNRTHLYDVGVNALSTYVNGVMVRHTEKPTTDVKGDLFYIDEQLSSMFIPYINRYEQEKCDNRFNNQDMYNVLMARIYDEANNEIPFDDAKITDHMEIQNAIGKEHCLVMKYFNSEHQLNQAKLLRKYILNEMKNNSLMYIIENIEHNESVVCRRQWKMDRNDNGNLPNSYTTTMRIMPGIINVYVNGVLLEKDDYAVFDNNKIMIGFDLVGGQEILPKNKGDYKHPYRVLTDEGFKFIECESDDEVTLEVRDDLTIKKRTYEIKDVSYETYSFDILDYDYPKSLMYTKDVIKIYINGVLYDGDYTNIDGVITLLECNLEEDPLYKYLRMHPSAMKEYESKYGEYIKHEDTITFEWR